ncbi:hypothetical protein GCM10023340_11700 [Nocardioides marinquilinus]|uniref:Choice-of-anchor D domain-containing protein n=1 Tax=Nocardioides marinquilinus TaxID=1210400 RepID=A0ABP9PH52_9ACTN
MLLRLRSLTPALVVAAIAGLALVALPGASSGQSPRPDTEARLLKIVSPSVTLSKGLPGDIYELTMRASVRNTTDNPQAGSTVSTYLRADSGRRYQVLTTRVGMLAPGATKKVGTTVDLPEKVRAGSYQVRTCVERKLFMDCQVQQRRIVLKPAELVIVGGEDAGDFGAVPLGATETRTFTVRNAGDITSGDITADIVKQPIDSPVDEDYAVTGTTCEVLRNRETCTVDVTFTPVHTEEIGESRALLRVAAQPGGRDRLQLTGTGALPPLRPSA